MTDLWPRLEPLLARAERPSRYIDHEFGSRCSSTEDDEAYRCAMVYPDTYEIGEPNQAVRILSNAVNARSGMRCERAYLPAPEFADIMRAEHLPLFTLESCAPLSELDSIGITLSHELVATNVLEVLDLSGLPLAAAQRDERYPLIVGGGPCACNPEPYSRFFDVMMIGEGERSFPDLLSAHRDMRAKGFSRAEMLRAMAKLPGCYVPSLYSSIDFEAAIAQGSFVRPLFDEVPARVEKTIWEGFSSSSAWEPCIVPFCETVHDRLNVEVLRGCTRGCRFCQAGMMYRPVRERSVDNIVEGVLSGLEATGYDEVSLTSLSTTDHSQIEEILRRLNAELAGKGISVSIPSQRLDAFGVGMATLVAGGKKGGLTFAPEAGTQRLRDVINKNVTEDDLLQAVDAAFAAGWRRCKLYFMIGLPTETDEDIEGIASMARHAYERARDAVPKEQRGHVRFGISCAVFVPKSQTPFQWDGQILPDEAKRRIDLLRDSVRIRAIDVGWHDPATSFVEATMSRGGRECAPLVEEAFRRGARFDAWSEHFNEKAWRDAADSLGIDMAAIAQASYPAGSVMPWSHIECGVDPAFLCSERLRAQEGETTPDCSFSSCVGCGICQSRGCELEIQGERHA